MNINKWFQENTNDLTGKVVVLTGATGGLGQEIAKYLIKLNAEIVFCYRNEILKEKFQRDNEYNKIIYLKLDLSNLDSVDYAIEYIKTMYPSGINYLINQAGVYKIQDSFTQDGYDLLFQTNHLSQYYLTKKLLPVLNMQSEARVINVNSISYNFVKIPNKNYQQGDYKSKIKKYALSKRYVTLCSIFNKFHLRNEYKNVKFMLAHPGVSATSLFKKKDGSLNKSLIKNMKFLFNKPKYASLNIIFAMFVKDIPYDFTMCGPRFFYQIWGKPKLHKKKLKTKFIHEINKAEENTNRLLNNRKII